MAWGFDEEEDEDEEEESLDEFSPSPESNANPEPTAQPVGQGRAPSPAPGPTSPETDRGGAVGRAQDRQWGAATEGGTVSRTAKRKNSQLPGQPNEDDDSEGEDTGTIDDSGTGEVSEEREEEKSQAERDAEHYQNFLDREYSIKGYDSADEMGWIEGNNWDPNGWWSGLQHQALQAQRDRYARMGAQQVDPEEDELEDEFNPSGGKNETGEARDVEGGWEKSGSGTAPAGPAADREARSKTTAKSSGKPGPVSGAGAGGDVAVPAAAGPVSDPDYAEYDRAIDNFNSSGRFGKVIGIFGPDGKPAYMQRDRPNRPEPGNTQQLNFDTQDAALAALSGRSDKALGAAWGPISGRTQQLDTRGVDPLQVMSGLVQAGGRAFDSRFGGPMRNYNANLSQLFAADLAASQAAADRMRARPAYRGPVSGGNGVEPGQPGNTPPGPGNTPPGQSNTPVSALDQNRMNYAQGGGFVDPNDQYLADRRAQLARQAALEYDGSGVERWSRGTDWNDADREAYAAELERERRQSDWARRR